jgi:hypothetical protein
MPKRINYAASQKRERDNNPREGDTTMKEGNEFVFKNGRWVKVTPASQGSRRNVRSTTAKPKPTNNKPRVANIPPSEGTGGKAETALKYGSGAPKPSPKPSPSASKPPAPTRSSTSSSSTPKPAGKVPASNAGMKNQDKTFRGNPERKDSIASTLRELRGMGSGRKVSGVGPVASGSDYAKARNDAAISKAQSDANKARVKQGPGAKKETLKERMERMKKLRNRTSWGGAD